MSLKALCLLCLLLGILLIPQPVDLNHGLIVLWEMDEFSRGVAPVNREDSLDPIHGLYEFGGYIPSRTGLITDTPALETALVLLRPSDTRLESAGTFTWAFMFQVDHLDTEHTLISKGLPSVLNLREFYVRVSPDGELIAGVSLDGTDKFLTVRGGANLAPGTWYAVRFFQNSATQTVGLQLDGNPLVTQSVDSLIFRGPDTFRVGNALEGTVAYLAKWDRMLSASEWRVYYTSLRNGKNPFAP